MQITVGLDFGTLNTKVCVETIDGNVTNYSFFKFDNREKSEYILPSEMFIDERGKITYGFVPESGNGRYIQNFKQKVFTYLAGNTEDKHHCIWFIANIIFDLEKIYSNEFTLQMGVPADISSLAEKKTLAKSIIASAYYLVEEVFKNDKKAFLKATEEELRAKTTIIEDEDVIQSYGTLVFPEAYAYLLMFTRQDSISRGMSLIVDLGGSTTDISFFNISTVAKAGSDPTICDFRSLNIGTNQLYMPQDKSDLILGSRNEESGLLQRSKSLIGIHSKTHNKNYRATLSDEIDDEQFNNFENTFQNTCQKLILDICKHYQQNNPGAGVQHLWNALKDRPIIYAGGGSMNAKFRLTYNFKGSDQRCFSDAKQISFQDWETKNFNVSHLEELKALNLIPILSTAYGLSHSPDDMNDEINIDSLTNIFKSESSYKDSSENSFNYGMDYDAYK